MNSQVKRALEAAKRNGDLIKSRGLADAVFSLMNRTATAMDDSFRGSLGKCQFVYA